jgi:hypothetical protein
LRNRFQQVFLQVFDLIAVHGDPGAPFESHSKTLLPCNEILKMSG